jgi:hypothetical protein
MTERNALTPGEDIVMDELEADEELPFDLEDVKDDEDDED